MNETVDPGRKPAILAVDDTPDTLMQIHGLLCDQYQVRCAVGAATALQTVTTPPLPELILLDVMMSEIDGYELCRRLKADPATAEIPVIFLTGKSDIEDEQRGLELGAVDYITKPISPPILAARVRNHLELHKRTRKLNNLAGQLSRYLAPQVYRSIFEGAQGASVGAHRKRLTILFAELMDFTESSESMEPEDLTWLLNNYFTEMSGIAMAYGGTLDNFVGDGMVIFFGDPETKGTEKDALQCVQMAVAMQRRMEELQKLWNDKGYEQPFRQRMGIHTGYCTVGNFGSDLRINYTAIGPAVNLAASLQQLGQPGEIRISYETHALVQEVVATEERPPIQFRGMSRAIKTYAVSGSAHQVTSG